MLGNQIKQHPTGNQAQQCCIRENLDGVLLHCIELIEFVSRLQLTKEQLNLSAAALIPTPPLGYDVDAALAKIDAGDRYRGGWWRNVVKPGLKALDDVQTPPQGGKHLAVTGEAPVDT